MLRRAGTRLLQNVESSVNSISPGPCIALSAQRCLSSASLATRNELGNSGFRDNNWDNSGAHCFAQSNIGMRGFSASGLTSGPEKTYDEDGSIQASAPSSSDVGSASDVPDVLGEDGLLGPDAIAHVVNAAEIGALAEAWDEAYFLNKGFQFLIQSFHSYTGLPWWQSIGLATVACRFLTFPLVVKQMGNTVKMSKAKPELQQLADWFKDKQAQGVGQDFQQEYMTRMALLWKKHDCHPFKSLLPIVIQAPIFIGFFGALRSMATAKVPSMMTGGVQFDWFGYYPNLYPDLTIADPMYSLPILSSVIFLISIELNAADGMQGQDEATLSKMKNFMRFIAVAMIPFTASMPMSVFCYWITSNLYSLVQSSVFKLAPIRSALGLPRLGQMSQGTGVSAAAVAVNAAGQPVQSFSTRPVKSSQTPSSQSSSSSEQPKTSHRQRRSQRQRRKS